MKIPGVSITLGVTQGTHTPYARVSGRSGILSATKNVNLKKKGGLLALAGLALVAFAAKKTAENKEKTPTGKKRKS